ncbi:pantoate--beta-alanine ligase [Bacillus carboniphilus]|uniref:Pantothenate synthetase n=1 Tax=Bacillus carboniphilus TaxID=86663 RepID=A0ABY9JWD9_9BACI|nr:pantoate--beta-alanine ligase [Bacillus carboniphilus]WLR43714.1 pantoate--beta-alanine ligase [Bacillus carboniphilus]
MILITDTEQMTSKAQEQKQAGKSIGFVPTMGFLHEGHLKLIEEARKENDYVVVSIYVNPLQFGPNEDYDQYPRNLERDLQLAKQSGVDAVFVPNDDTMYRDSLTIKMTVTDRVDVLCGATREGHFDGVVTVVSKLFNLIQPNRAYFGMKDAQQVAVIDALIGDYFFPIELCKVDTVRESDGLAKSSRNVNLTNEERQQAVHLYQSLKKAKMMINQGERSPDRIEQFIKDYIMKNTSGTIDYVSVLSYPELAEINCINGQVIMAMAVKFSRVRLIDNLIITVNKRR